VFFGRKVKVEGSAHHAHRVGDGGDIRCRQTRTAYFGDRGIEYARARFKSSGLSGAAGGRSAFSRGVRRLHIVTVRAMLTVVNDGRQ